ncbi:Trehalose 6-phosphate synthase, family GT20 / Trehalose 6-phosphate phosphatase [Ectocarpus siliculosus]|uniref:Trehalose 6-phosphate synthase, family GT20 / Trehalose 6-phosphate phosphatase n=1 Tax=Ectocarpus siliculosus TaxID=2880 RepID=D7FT10_ECTSI|nr:Trehalose 6-phosphate synthase, family GT20 / Trehalose 6-phosphate phosphatase [Ectocarpus siliculosus]|eukprot:CBJ31301.1 Trehalose 6-phosphate synthase, family GT20 / Trehalose 6-phosphate phosphatase [Ectocarpus siliculosus]
MFSRLNLTVECPTEFGQTVHVSGSSFLAGVSNPSLLVEMVTTPEEYPLWRTPQPIIVQRNQPHKYIYSLFEGGKFKKWEESSARVIKCDEPSVHQRDEFVGHETDISDYVNPDRQHSGLNTNPKPSSSTSLPRENVEPPPDSVLYLVCFHLPLTLKKDWKGTWQAEWNESLIAKTEDSVSTRIPTHWVGTVASNDGKEFTEADEKAITQVLRPMNCTPIFVPLSIIRGSYLGYCKQILWPAFHNVDVLDLASCRWNPHSTDPTLTWDQQNTVEWWEAFKTLNTTFADHMMRMLGERGHRNNVMWVHDYHLMLLPKLLSDREKDATQHRQTSIIFFLHIPFPTSQIFRALAHGEELLQGVLSADIVGFHAFDHARHFLNAGKRLLGLSYQSIKGGLIGVEYDRRTVMVVMSHVGIEPKLLKRHIARKDTEQAVKVIQKKHGNRVIMAGVDVCQKLSGVTLKLLAFERLLTEYPNHRDEVVLVQRCLRPSSRVEDEEHTSAEIKQLVARIQQQFGEGVIDYTEVVGNDLSAPERLALFKCARVLVLTAVREGLNLIPLEYIFARGEPESAGVVLASEFSACSSLLNGAMRINPFDVAKTAGAFAQALTMSEAERSGRRDRDLPYISSRPSALWTYQALLDMWAMKNEASVTHIEETASLANELTHEMTMTDFTPLDVDDMMAAYRHSKSRVILLDYGGSLLEKEGLGKYLKRNMSSASGRKLPQPTYDAVVKLCEDKANTVFIVSGLNDKGLMNAVGAVPGLGLAANNGLAFSWPVEVASERSWEVFDYGVDWDEVKTAALPLLQKFTAHTNGANIKMRDSGLAWSYYSTDPEWGQTQAKQLHGELEVALSAYDVKVQHLRGSLEVVPKRLHKGVVVSTILRTQKERRGCNPDFVFCVGDDASDEQMFSAVYSFLAQAGDQTGSNDEMTQAEMDNIRLYTCMVGKKPTHANFYVNDPSEVAQTLSRMAGTDKKDPADAAAAAAERQQGRGGVDGVGSSSKGGARLESFLARSLM